MSEAVLLPRSGAELDLKYLAAEVVARAQKAGATDAEAVVSEGDEFSVSVRVGEVETLQESGSRGMGLRVFVGRRSASAWSGLRSSAWNCRISACSGPPMNA